MDYFIYLKSCACVYVPVCACLCVCLCMNACLCVCYLFIYPVMSLLSDISGRQVPGSLALVVCQSLLFTIDGPLITITFTHRQCVCVCVCVFACVCVKGSKM